MRWLLLLVGGVATLLLLPNDAFPDYRYKMTVYVQTPGGLRAFSSVRQVRVWKSRSIVDSAGVREKVRVFGEAVVLPLPGRTVYAPLTRPDDYDYSAYVAGAALSPHARKERSFRASEHLAEASYGLQQMVKVEGPKELPRTRPNRDPYRGPRQIEQWPVFVSFAEPSDPSTLKILSPESVGVRKITIEITRDDVSDVVRRYMTESFWTLWGERRRERLVDAAYRPSPAAQFDRGSFEMRED